MSRRDLTPDEAMQIQFEMTRRGAVVHWTVTTGTTDLGSLFAAKAHFLIRENGKPVHKVSAHSLVAASLAELREKLPPGVTNIGRQPADDPVIVEVWI